MTSKAASRPRRRRPVQGSVAAGRVVTAGGGRRLDANDFRELYDARVVDVARWIRALGATASEQDDIIQQVFVVVHRRLPDFDGTNLAGWLYRITANQVRDFRRLRWIKHIFKRSIPLSSRLASPGLTPLSMLERKEEHALLQRLLSTLGQAQRAAFVMFELDGYTGEEIAQAQQVSVNTVRARIHRARKKLTALLGKWRQEEDDVPHRGRGPARGGNLDTPTSC